MASITIRNLDESTKQALRERAAQNGRSMEEEARLRLGQAELAEPQPPIPTKTSISSANYDASLDDKRILLIIGGGIAAYKCLDLIRRLKERGAAVRVILTPAAGEFITPLSVGALSGDKVFSDLFDRDDEHDVGHIRLSRKQ
ncbi:MAG: bifunctional phosphopantothenoylcysteine decarboxylase/phosphopantothenate synthase, partial [Rhizobiaceae bacterium]|nr:bifunctional phosphopantothenoylcysteine decarboxylase/phosphopantothenate synthase [Rhizobiaceae bacterium]